MCSPIPQKLTHTFCSLLVLLLVLVDPFPPLIHFSCPSPWLIICSSREGWAFVDALPDDQVCDAAKRSNDTKLPIALHYCKRYAHLVTGTGFMSFVFHHSATSYNNILYALCVSVCFVLRRQISVRSHVFFQISIKEKYHGL